jgi:hypothetical protein
VLQVIPVVGEFAHTMYLLLIQLICSCGDVHSHSALLRSSGQLYTAMKYSGTNIAICITDEPAESLGSISRGQCVNACNRLGWNWFNFIASDNSAERDVGECQWFNVKPQKYAEVPNCSAFTRFAHFHLSYKPPYS